MLTEHQMKAVEAYLCGDIYIELETHQATFDSKEWSVNFSACHYLPNGSMTIHIRKMTDVMCCDEVFDLHETKYYINLDNDITWVTKNENVIARMEHLIAQYTHKLLSGLIS